MRIHGLKYLILFFLIAFFCNAQNPIKPLFNNEIGSESGAYYKDFDHDLDNFTGTWVSTAGNATFTITLQKLEVIQVSDYYEDVLVGGYSYKVGNNLLVDTTDQLNNPATPFFSYYLYSISLLRKHSGPICNECLVNERRVRMGFNDPYRQNIPGLSATLVLRRINENGVAKLQAKLIQESNAFQEEGQPAPPNDFTVPFGEYVLTKIDY